MTWVAEHTGYEKPNGTKKAYFADTMVKGPFGNGIMTIILQKLMELLQLLMM